MRNAHEIVLCLQPNWAKNRFSETRKRASQKVQIQGAIRPKFTLI